jgi:hypothetical protein
MDTVKITREAAVWRKIATTLDRDSRQYSAVGPDALEKFNIACRIAARTNDFDGEEVVTITVYGAIAVVIENAERRTPGI